LPGQDFVGWFDLRLRVVRAPNQAFVSKESVMSEPKDQPEFQNTVEVDRQAWNLPSPQPQPVGPMRDVWPVGPAPTRGVEHSLLEDPAAA